MEDVSLNEEFCRTCGKCCKEWWIYTNDKDEAERAEWLSTRSISVEKIRDGLWVIRFHIPCSKLAESEGKFTCARHAGHRPSFCIAYPMNFLEDDVEQEVLVHQMQKCPELARMVRLLKLNKKQGVL